MSSFRLPSSAPSSPEPEPVTEPPYEVFEKLSLCHMLGCTQWLMLPIMPLLWSQAHQCQLDVLVGRLQRCCFPVNLQRFLISARVVIQSPQRGQDLSLLRYLQCPAVWDKGMFQGGVRNKLEEKVGLCWDREPKLCTIPTWEAHISSPGEG